MKGRFAPSPTGALHLGNMRTFLATWVHARQNSVKLLMRMEDLNIVRLKDGAIQQIYDDFHWLGLDWDLGAGLVEGEELDIRHAKASTYYQSSCKSLYKEVFDSLLKRELIYPCSCSRKDIQMIQSAPHEENELQYPNTCRGRWSNEDDARVAKGQSPSWRFKVLDEQTSFFDEFYGQQSSKIMDWSGDFVVAKSSDELAYQLAVVIDDERQGVEWVIRGDDLMLSTHRQIQLQKVLGYRSLKYMHLPLLIGPDGKRLAKRHGDWKISSLRSQGFKPEAVIGLLAWTLGQVDYGENVQLNDLTCAFDWSKIPKNNFEITKQVRKDYNL